MVRVIVAYKPGAEASARAAIAAAGGRVVVDLSDDNALSVELPARALAALQRHAAVDFVEDDPVRYAFGPFGARPGRRVTPAAGGTQTTPYGISMVQADQVSDSLASDRKLCIIDSGIDRAHEDLNGITVDGVNLTTSGDWFTDENSHGTHVAGTIAAIDNTLGVIGVLPHRQISIYIAKVFDASGSAPSSVIAKAMQSLSDRHTPTWSACPSAVRMQAESSSASSTAWQRETSLSSRRRGMRGTTRRVVSGRIRERGVGRGDRLEQGVRRFLAVQHRCRTRRTGRGRDFHRPGGQPGRRLADGGRFDVFGSADRRVTENVGKRAAGQLRPG